MIGPRPIGAERARRGEAAGEIAASAARRVRWEGALAERLQTERRTLVPAETPAAHRDRRLVALAVHERRVEEESDW